jgi:hypothetical protein
LQNYVTEVIRLPKQALDCQEYVSYLAQLRNEIAKFGKQGKIDLPEFLKMMKGNVIPSD